MKIHIRNGRVIDPAAQADRNRAWFGATDQYRAGKSFEPVDGQWMDPLALFTAPPLDSASLAARPEADKRIPFAYFDTRGTLSQPQAKTVWPFACTRKQPAP